MTFNKKGIAIRTVTTALLISTALSSVAFAKEEREKIGKIELDIRYDINKDNVDITIDSDSDKYSIDDYEIANEPAGESWGSYDTPRVTVYLSADSDYYFTKSGSSYFKFKGDEVDYVTSKKDDDKSEMELVIDLIPVNGSIGNPSNLKWSNKGNASWDSAYKAKKYEVRVVRNDSTVNGETLTTTNTSIDCLKYINNTGNYKFKVRAINSERNSEWVESDEWVVTWDVLQGLDSVWENNKEKSLTEGKKEPGIVESTTGWIKDNTGWWYKNLDGKYTTNNWQQINNKWYYFDERGYMKTGWLQLGDKWYYLETANSSEQGEMKTGWINVSNIWYCLKDDGSMYANTTTPDGYRVNESGAWIQ